MNWVALSSMSGRKAANVRERQVSGTSQYLITKACLVVLSVDTPDDPDGNNCLSLSTRGGISCLFCHSRFGRQCAAERESGFRGPERARDNVNLMRKVVCNLVAVKDHQTAKAESQEKLRPTVISE